MLFHEIQNQRSQVAFVQTALWFIGEYGDLLLEPYDAQPSAPSTSSRPSKNRKKGTSSPIHFDAVEPGQLLDLLSDFLHDRNCNEETRTMLLTSVLKLSDRFDASDSRELTELTELQKMVESCEASQDLELAQRASE